MQTFQRSHDNEQRGWRKLTQGWRALLTVCLLLTAMFSTAPAPAEDDLLDKPFRHLFVPLDEFDAVMARNRNGVLLKRTEFEALVADAIKNKPAGGQPSGLVISSSAYSAKIDGDQLVVSATIRFTNFEKSWVEFHVPTDGLSVEKCLINGQPALAGWHGENPNILRVFTDQPGAAQLSLELSARLSSVGSDLSTAFGVVPAASGELTVSLPPGKFLVADGTNVARPGAADQPADYRIAIGGKNHVSLQITNRQASTRSDSLTLVNTAMAVAVAPGEVSWSTKASLQIVGRPLDRVLCTVPKTLEITSVESTGLDSWQLGETPNDPTRTTITLAYRQAFDGSREIQFRGVLKAASDMAWEVPALVFNDITSQVGVAEVRYPAGVRLRVGELDGVRTVVSQAATADNGDALLHFQIWKAAFRLPFVTEPKTREVRAAVTNLLDLNASGLDFTSVINLQTRLAPLFDAQVNLPAGWQVRSVFLGDQPISWQVVPMEAGVNQIRVTFPIPIPADGTVALTVNAGFEPEKWPVEETAVRVGLPRIGLPQAGIIEGLYGITTEAALELVPSDLVGLDGPSPEELATLKQKIALSGRELRLGFSLQDTEYSGQLAVSRKPARISSQASTFFRIEPESLTTHIETQLKLEGGGVRQLAIDLPETTGTDLRFQLSSGIMPAIVQTPNGTVQQMISLGSAPLRIVEQTSEAPKNGIRRWLLRLDRYATGSVLLSVDIRHARSGPGPFNCPVLAVVGAEREAGFVAIEASQEQFLTPLATDVSGQALIKVDPVDFPPAMYHPKEPIVAGYRYTRPGWALAVGEQRFERAQVPTAVGHSTAYQTVLGRNGELQHQCDLVFTAIGVQNLKVRLPDQVELWSVQLDGQPQEIRRQNEGLLVAVPQDGQTDRRHTLTLFYRAAESGGVANDFRQNPPSFTVLDGQGAEQPLAILQQTWKLDHPDHLLLIGSPGAFQPKDELDSDGELDQWSALLHAPSPQQIRDAVLQLAIVFLIVWGIRKTVTRFGWWKTIGGSMAGLMVVLVGWSLLPSKFATTSMNDRTAIGFDEEYSVMGAPAAPMSAPAAAFDGEIAEMDMTFDAPPGGMGGMGGGGMGGGIFGGRQAGAAPGAASAESLPPPAPTPLAAEPEMPADADKVFSDPKPTLASRDHVPVEEKFLAEQKEKAADFRRQVGGPLEPFAEGAKPNVDGRNGSFNQAFGDVERAKDSKGDDTVDALSVSRNDLGMELQSKPQAGKQAELGGLLSLALAMAHPDDSRTREFTYQGDGSQTADLHLKFLPRDRSRDWTSFVTAAVVVLFWFLRQQPLSRLASLVALLILGSVAVAPLLPTRCQSIMDGLFFGGWAALGLGLVYFGMCWIKSRCCPALTTPANTSLTTSALLLALAFASSQVQAQDQKAIAPPEPPRIPNHVVLPYTGDDPATADRVYIPQPLFLELWKRSHPQAAIKPNAPVDGWVVEVLHAAEFKEAGKESTVHFKSRMVLITLRETQFAQLLPIKEVALANAVLDGQPAALQTEGGEYKVIVDKPGLHVLDVEFDLPATTEGPAGRFTLKVHPTAAGRLSLQLPKIMGDRDLKVNGATGVYRIREADAGPVLETAVDRGGDVTVSWQPRAVRGAGNTIVHVDTGAAVVVDDAGLQLNHQFAYKVRQGSINELVFQAPPSLSIREISGPDVGGWQIDGQKDSTRLKVFLRRTVEDQTNIVIDLFTPLSVTSESQSLPIPELVPMDATREIGQIGLFAPAEFALRATEVKGATQIDVGKYQPVVVPHRPEAAPLAAYRFATRPASLTAALSRRQPETKCVAEHGVLVGPRKLEWATHLQFDLTGAPRPSISVTLPADYLLMDVDGSEFISDWYDTPGDGGQRTLTVEFDQPRLGQVTVLLTGQSPRKPESVNADLLPPQPLGAARLTSSLAVWLSDVYSATIRTSTGWKTTAPEQLSERLRGLRSTPVQFAFRATEPVSSPVAVELSRQVAQLSSDLVVLAAVADDSIDYGLTFRWKISRAASDTFRFITPGWLKERLELTVPGLRQVDSQALENGDILWTIQLIDAVRGQFLCSGVVTLPPPSDDTIQIPDVRFVDRGDTGELTPLESQRRCAIVVNRSQAQLLPIDDRLLNKIPREQLPLIVQTALLDQALAITELSREQALPKWKISRSTTQDTGRATVTGSELVTSVTWDGTWRTKAIYTVRNRGQQFLGLKRPEGSQVLSVFVKGKPSRTVTTKLKEQSIDLIPLPQTSVVDLSFDVEVTLSGKLATPLEAGWFRSQTISIPAPDVVSRDESADFGLTVAHTLWEIHTPDKLDVTLSRNGSNVDLLTEEESQLTRGLVQAQKTQEDYRGLEQVLKQSTNSTLRAQARNNLKQLGDNLQRNNDWQKQNRSKAETVQLYDQVQSLNESLQRDIHQFSDIDSDAPAQQAVPQAAGLSDNRDFVNLNNFGVIAGNGAADGIVIQNSSGAGLKFQNDALVESESTVKRESQVAAKGKVLSRGRGELRKSLQSQSYGNAIQRGGEQAQQQAQQFNMPSSGAVDLFAASRPQGNMAGDASFTVNSTSGGIDLSGGTNLAFSALGSGGWTHAGGLSLPVQIPAEARKTAFSRVNGSPQVTLTLRPRQAWTRSLTWLWSLCWAAIAVWTYLRIRHSTGTQSLRPVLAMLAVLGAIGYVLLPIPLKGISMLVFLVCVPAALLTGISRESETPPNA